MCTENPEWVINTIWQIAINSPVKDRELHLLNNNRRHLILQEALRTKCHYKRLSRRSRTSSRKFLVGQIFFTTHCCYSSWPTRIGWQWGCSQLSSRAMTSPNCWQVMVCAAQRRTIRRALHKNQQKTGLSFLTIPCQIWVRRATTQKAVSPKNLIKLRMRYNALTLARGRSVSFRTGRVRWNVAWRSRATLSASGRNWKK